MRSFSGKITHQGPFVDITVMQTHQHVARLKAARRTVASPSVVRALVDTGASCSVLEKTIVAQLGLIQTGRVQVHSPTTDGKYEERDQFASCFFFGSQPGEVKAFNVNVLATDLASEGFLAIIGWDILKDCILHCDGPNQIFQLDY